MTARTTQTSFYTYIVKLSLPFPHLPAQISEPPLLLPILYLVYTISHFPFPLLFFSFPSPPPLPLTYPKPSSSSISLILPYPTYLSSIPFIPQKPLFYTKVFVGWRVQIGPLPPPSLLTSTQHTGAPLGVNPPDSHWALRAGQTQERRQLTQSNQTMTLTNAK